MNRCNRRSFGGLLLWVALLVVIIAAVFSGVCRHEFLMYDDQQHLLDNPRLNPVSWRDVGLFWVEQSYWGLYIPLSYTFFAAEAWISGTPLSPVVFHLGNLLLHVVAVLLVFAILRRLLRHDGAAAAGALLFGLHPVQVESVAWVSETRGLLCAVFSLAAIWLFDVWLAGAAPREASARWRAAAYVAASVALVLALLSKPAAVAVPLVAGVLAAGTAQRPLRRAFRGLCPWLVAAAGWVVLTKFQQPSGRMALTPPIWTRPLIAGDALAFYIWELAEPLWYLLRLAWHLLVAPWQGLEPLRSWASPHLYGPDYGRAPAWVIQQWWLYATWIVPAGLLGLLAAMRNRRLWLTAAGVFVAWLLPVLGLVPFDFQRISTVADRYIYLSLLGPALALGWFLARPRSRLTIAASAAGLCLLAALSFAQVTHWHSDETLIAYGLRLNPRSALARQHSAVLLSRAGRHQEAIAAYRQLLEDYPQHEEAYLNLANSLILLERIDEAEAVLREAVRQLPMRPSVHQRLGQLLAERGNTLKKQGKTDEAMQRFGQAEESLRKAIECDPTWCVPYWSLARLRLDRGATDEALGLCRKAVDVAPYDVEARLELARTLEWLGRVPEALAEYRVALRMRPDFPRANFNLANLLMAQGAVEAAIVCFRAELKSYPEYAPAHVNLGIALFEQAQVAEAIGHFQEALRIDPKLTEAHVHLGHALAMQDRRDEAAAEYRAALELVPPDSDEAKRIRGLLGQLGVQ